jgi:hypothetical protein
MSAESRPGKGGSGQTDNQKDHPKPTKRRSPLPGVDDRHDEAKWRAAYGIDAVEPHLLARIRASIGGVAA